MFGTINAANQSNNGVSRFDFAKKIIELLQVDIELVPCKIDDLKDEFPCKRTNYEVLSNNFLMRHWEEALKEYLNDYFKY